MGFSTNESELVHSPCAAELVFHFVLFLYNTFILHLSLEEQIKVYCYQQHRSLSTFSPRPISIFSFPSHPLFPFAPPFFPTTFVPAYLIPVHSHRREYDGAGYRLFVLLRQSKFPYARLDAHIALIKARSVAVLVV